LQEKLVNSMTQEDFEPASCPEEEVRCTMLGLVGIIGDSVHGI
jgi:hypothetical protein